jgi:hypothetical protein
VGELRSFYERSNMSSTGYIGLGNMGHAMATRLRNAQPAAWWSWCCKVGAGLDAGVILDVLNASSGDGALVSQASP